MKIIIGYDGSDCAESALDDLQKAGLPPDAEIAVLSVTEVWLPPPAPSANELIEEIHESKSPAELERVYESHSASVEDAKELADQAAARLRANFPSWSVTTEGRYGSPARELILKADEVNADLIIVGSHGRSALGRFMLGSVSQKVVTEARCSVRVARGRVEVDHTPPRIIVGADGSYSSEAAVRAVARRSWPKGTEAMVVLVDDPLVPTFLGRYIPPVAQFVEESNREEHEWVKAIVGSSVEGLQKAGITVSSLIKEGDPKKVLVEVASEWKADCMFLGSTGFGSRLERFLLGSVSAAVVARAHCSVEVVREAQEPQG